MAEPENIIPAMGIARKYLDIHHQQQEISQETEQLLQAALDRYPLTSTNAPLPSVWVRCEGKKALNVAGSGNYHWVLLMENGKKIEGNIAAGQLLVLPEFLQEGYHQLTLSQQQCQWHCRIIIAPKRCYQPPVLMSGKKLWGACVQLYTLRSLNNWGIGDFGDLQKMLREIVHSGGDFIGLNPLHALYPAQPENASPYSPSSRHWLNIIYIDVNAVEDFQNNKAAEVWWAQPVIQRQLEQVRNSEWVDYQGVMALKLEALSIAWQKFYCRDEKDHLQREFQHFVERGADGLYWQAVHDALHQWLNTEHSPCDNWSQWPKAYQSKQSTEVADFCRSHAGEIEFHCWLQWLAYRQLVACWDVCLHASMSPGLYRDLAVGVAQYSAATWCDPELYCMDVATGAPPDPLGPQGQNWQLPPMNPKMLIERGYQPFIELLLANMRHCGALRIDHVMSLLRLWWVPQGKSAIQGAYVHYPLEDLLAIVALESQRHQCMVIGEDLGNVPEQFRIKLHARGVYSYKVLYFEQDTQYALPAPADWLTQAIVMVNTHDLPTLRGYWEVEDLKMGQSLGIYPDGEQLNHLLHERKQQKQGIVDSLHRYRCLPSRVGNQGGRFGMTPVLRQSIYRYLASCYSALFGVQPEDWLDMVQPVNVPGTSTQYPNWRRKLSRTLDEIFVDPTISRLLSMISKYRKRASVRNKMDGYGKKPG